MRSAIEQGFALAIAALVASSALVAVPAAGQLGVPVHRADPIAADVDRAGLAVNAPAALLPARVRLDGDRAALRTFRPGFSFWRHIFTIPDGSVAFGSAVDGRLLAVFPIRGNWAEEGRWYQEGLEEALAGVEFDRDAGRRRAQVANALEAIVGPVVQNETRGDFLLPNARRYGSFISEWGAIFERFGVPAEIGLAQAILESGLNGRVRSEARALGFCQWLPQNWDRLDDLSPHVLEGYNQTTQAPYCAAYLSILAAKYGSFIPALSEHHAGGTNVGRVVITGERLGGVDARQRYLLGARFARDLRDLDPRAFGDVYGSYGPRSYRYAEMVFGNAANVPELVATIPQQRIHAMRTRRSVPLSEITRRTGLPADEIRRFNPALVRQVPAKATLYLPTQIDDLGTDVAFWHRPPDPAYAALLDEFVRLDATLEQWSDPAFREVLRDFQRRFAATGTEEGSVMATVLAYAAQEMYGQRRMEILAEYERSARIRELYLQGVLERGMRREVAVVGGRPEPARFRLPDLRIRMPRTSLDPGEAVAATR